MKLRTRNAAMAAVSALLLTLFAAAFGFGFIGAKASDFPAVPPVSITGQGTASDPYEGYRVDSANTWWSPGTPCLFGGGNANECSSSSYSVIGFKVRVSGIYQLSVTMSTYSQPITVQTRIYEADSPETIVMDTTDVSFPSNTGDNAVTSPSGTAELQAGTLYAIRINGKTGYDCYTRSMTLTYLDTSAAYPIPDIKLAGLGDDDLIVSGAIGQAYTLPQATADGFDSIFTKVYAPDGSEVDISGGSFMPDQAGNYIIVYSTDADYQSSQNYASRTIVLQIAAAAGEVGHSFDISATNFTDMQNFGIDPVEGIGGTSQKASASMTFIVNASSNYQDAPLSLAISGYSSGANQIGVTINDGEEIVYDFEDKTELQTVTMDAGTLGGEADYNLLRNEITVRAMTENATLTLTEITGTVSLQANPESAPVERQAFSETFLDLYNDPNTAVTGSLTATANGLTGFNKYPESYAAYSVNAAESKDYYLILTYSRMAGQTQGASVIVSANGTDIPVSLDSLATSQTTTPNSEADAYKIRLNAGENEIRIVHAEGTGYYISNIKISDDLVAPQFSLSSTPHSFDGAQGTEIVLPYATITDADQASFMTAYVVSDNADSASISGTGTQDDPFIFTASAAGKYTVRLQASDTAGNLSGNVDLTVFVTATEAPVIDVSLDKLTVRSGFDFEPAEASAVYKGEDVTAEIQISLTDSDGTQLTDGFVDLAGFIYKFTETGSYRITYACTVDGVSAYEKIVEIEVIPTASLNGNESGVTVSGGFTSDETTGAISHPNDGAYASHDGFSFDFTLNTAGNYLFGIELDLYSTNYSILYSYDGGSWHRFSAQSGTNPMQVFSEEEIALSAGQHTLTLVAETVGGDAWLYSVMLRNADTGAQRIFSCSDIYSDPAYNFSFTGDLRYMAAQGTFGRMNANADPTVSSAVTVQTSGMYTVSISYRRTSTDDAAPLLYLYVNGTPFAVEFSADDTDTHTVTQTIYLPAGNNTISLSGIKSRNYTLLTIDVVFAEAAEHQQATISAQAPSSKLETGQTLNVSAATVPAGGTAILSVKIGEAEIYRGENKALTFEDTVSGTYTITYYYIDENGIQAVAPVTFTVTVADPEPDVPVEPDLDETPDQGGPEGWAIALIVVGAVIVAGAVAAIIVRVVKKKKTVLTDDKDKRSDK